MKLISILSIASVATTANAIGCYSKGEKWGDDAGSVLGTIKELCFNGTFNTEYPAGNNQFPVTRQWDLPSHRRVFLSVSIDNVWGKTALSPYDCKKQFNTQVKSCEHGGIARVSRWLFKADIDAIKK
ncbi:hypothetical protein F4779DRAFT_623434 [Xylariaceae sp. FL0662B]|nr:hypothetical protein F4779DRAFT_623434 [Xylariaceae sp. FL0662B]